MSGRDGGRNDNPTPVDSCDQLKFTTQLASPKEAVVEQMNVEDVLDIAIGEQNGQAVVQALWNGQIAGGIADQKLHRLRQCLGEGVMYAATVLGITNGQVRVRVFPVNVH